MSVTQTSFVYASVLYLIFTTLVFPYCSYCIYRFICVTRENWNEKYFRHRHPISNIIFLLCFLIATFLISPLEVIFCIIGYENESTLKTIDIMHDITSVIIFAIFMCRVWFLFSDWSFHYNMSSWIWKREINPLQTNCIIKYRQIFGNKKCCYLFIFLLLFLPIIIILDIIPLFINNKSEILFRIGIVIIFIACTLFILLSQLKRVLDVYNIRKELLYEISIFGSLLLFSEIFSNLLLLINLINNTQQILFLSIFSSITGTLVIYVGTNWVLKQFERYKLFQSIGKFAQQKDQRINCEDLIAILNTEQGFESFLLHLVNELQLEKMLFVIEVLQFKQEIKKRLNKMDLAMDEYNKSSMLWLKLNYILNDMRQPIDTNDANDTNDSNKNKMDILVLSQINISDLEIPNDPRLTEWTIYHFSVHLYDKYIEEGAALQLNVSSDCIRFIYSYFRARTMSPQTTPFATPSTASGGHDTAQHMEILKGVEEETEENERELEEEEIELVLADDDDDDENDNENETAYPSTNTSIIPTHSSEAMDKTIGVDGVHGDQNISVAYDLFRLYDNALYEVWNSISNEIFNRFKTTSEYGAIYASIYNNNKDGQAHFIKKKKLALIQANSYSFKES